MERENYEEKSMQVQNCRREEGRLNFLIWMLGLPNRELLKWRNYERKNETERK